ncbi:MAG: Na+/H+ antiporter subunit E [Thermoleophilaceae bacterium]
MRSALARAALPVALLVLTYALAIGSFAPADLALGTVIAVGGLLTFRRLLLEDAAPPPPGGLAPRIVAFVPFAVTVLRDVVMGTWEVSLFVVGMRPLARPGVVAVPIEQRTATGVAVSALASTLSPGEFLLDVDLERGVMLFHVIDARDPQAVKARHRETYRRYQRRVFP